MPTNLPPEALEAERRYRTAITPEEKIVCLEEFISLIPKHKGTDKLRADLRKKLSKLKSGAQTRKGASRQVSAFHIDKEGAGQVVLIGPTNVGKSALVAALTNAAPEVADHPYTTWTPTPGMMPMENVQIQLIDTPPMDRNAFIEPELFNLLRKADLTLLMIDLQSYPIEQLEESIAILEERRIVPRHLQGGCASERRPTFIPLLVLVNKVDDERLDEDFEALRELLGEDWPLLPISVATGRNLERFKRAVFERLGIIRVYSKPPGQEPNLDTPFILDEDSTVEEFAVKVHRDFFENLKSARIWGSAVYDGQMVGRDHVLQDGDVVELRI